MTLVKLTNEGAEIIRERPERAQATQAHGERLGIRLHGWDVTQGEDEIGAQGEHAGDHVTGRIAAGTPASSVPPARAITTIR